MTFPEELDMSTFIDVEDEVLYFLTMFFVNPFGESCLKELFGIT